MNVITIHARTERHVSIVTYTITVNVRRNSPDTRVTDVSKDSDCNSLINDTNTLIKTTYKILLL